MVSLNNVTLITMTSDTSVYSGLVVLASGDFCVLQLFILSLTSRYVHIIVSPPFACFIALWFYSITVHR